MKANWCIRLLLAAALALAPPVFAATPTIEGYVETSVSVPSTTFTINLPAGLTATDNLMIFTAVKNGASVSITNSVGCFTMYHASGTNGGVTAQAVHCDRGRSVGLTSLSAQSNYATELEAIAIRVSGGHEGSGSIGMKAWSTATCPKILKAPFSYTFGPPNPPAVNPGQWDVEGTLWIEVVHNAYANPITMFSTGYDDNQFSGGSGGPFGLRLALATRVAAVASDDPGVLTATTASQCVAATIALRPSP